MKKKITAGLLIVLICVASVEVGKRYFSPRASFSLEKRAFLRSMGEPGAPLWIVEYFDYQCLPCHRSMDFIRDYLKFNQRKTYFQARFFPLDNRAYSLKAARYAECAARQGKFWKFNDLLFERQKEWITAAPEKIDNLLRQYALMSGLNAEHLSFCLKSAEIDKAIEEEKKVAKSMGVKSTPTFFVNGKMIVGVEAFMEHIKNLDKKGK